jgi:hypothetical protein
LRLLTAFAKGDDGNFIARHWCGHQEGSGPAGAQAHYDDADIRQAADRRLTESIARRANLGRKPVGIKPDKFASERLNGVREEMPVFIMITMARRCRLLKSQRLVIPALSRNRQHLQ